MLRTGADPLPPPPPRRPDPPSVLVGYDGSPPARAAVRWALARAGVDGRVYIGHVVEPESDAGTGSVDSVIAAQHELGLGLLRELSHEIGPGPRLRVLIGEPAQALIEAAHGLTATELAVGSHSRSPKAGSSGHVRRALLRRFDRPVITVPPEAAIGMGAAYRLRRILILADAATEHPHVAATAAVLGAQVRAAIDVVAISNERRRGRDVAEQVHARLREADLCAEVGVVDDELSDARDLRRVMSDRDSDLLVVGRRVRAGTPPIGRLASEAAERAPRPVMVVPVIGSDPVIPLGRSTGGAT
jgi:hypothetical protein